LDSLKEREQGILLAFRRGLKQRRATIRK